MNDRNGREKAEQGYNKIRSSVCNAAESYGTCLFAGRFLGIRDLCGGRLFYSGHYVLFSGGGISIDPLKKEVRTTAPALCNHLTGTVSGGSWHTAAEYAVHPSLLLSDPGLSGIHPGQCRAQCVCLSACGCNVYLRLGRACGGVYRIICTGVWLASEAAVCVWRGLSSLFPCFGGRIRKNAFVGTCGPARIAGRSRNSGFRRGDHIFLQWKKNRHRRPVLEMVLLCVLSDASLCIVGHQ